MAYCYEVSQLIGIGVGLISFFVLGFILGYKVNQDLKSENQDAKGVDVESGVNEVKDGN